MYNVISLKVLGGVETPLRIVPLSPSDHKVDARQRLLPIQGGSKAEIPNEHLVHQGDTQLQWSIITILSRVVTLI